MHILSKFYFGKFQSYLGQNKGVKELFIWKLGEKISSSPELVALSVQIRELRKRQMKLEEYSKGPLQAQDIEKLSFIFPYLKYPLMPLFTASPSGKAPN